MTAPATGSSSFEPGDSEDSLASAEALKLATGQDIEAEGKRKEHERHQTFRDQVNIATLGLLWLVVISVGLGMVAYVYHLISPPAWHFLREAQLDKLETLLAAALLSSALTGYVNKRVS